MACLIAWLPRGNCLAQGPRVLRRCLCYGQRAVGCEVGSDDGLLVWLRSVLVG